MRSLFSAFIAILMLSACATTYTGPSPDFSKKGGDAFGEYEKFELAKNYGALNLYSARMGNQDYYRESVDPIINEISPASTVKLKRMDVAKYANWAIFAATMVCIFQPRDTWANSTGYWLGLAGILGTGIYINIQGMGAAENYNKDLKSKFTPSLAFSTTF